ncbi:MAG TPA: DUF167 family protein [Pseudolabrys sp.]|nr:DUF167 family protein [Pseudolabrys sp.]
MAPVPWSPVAGGISLIVRLTPRGGRDAVDGIETMSDGTVVLKVRVRVAPAEGQANAALIGLIARTLGVPPRDVNLATGATSRVKRLVISGNGPTLIAALEKISASR